MEGGLAGEAKRSCPGSFFFSSLVDGTAHEDCENAGEEERQGRAVPPRRALLRGVLSGSQIAAGVVLSALEAIRG